MGILQNWARRREEHARAKRFEAAQPAINWMVEQRGMDRPLAQFVAGACPTFGKTPYELTEEEHSILLFNFVSDFVEEQGYPWKDEHGNLKDIQWHLDRGYKFPKELVELHKSYKEAVA